ncbi:MFS transporter [Paraburkholderia susongensis]|uniref:MFS transporter, ACS family, hexuronate transporter n=1 Tax=Paraburkholderia susongensis TaxID=1515439 RepID=A0A1X7LPN1_9BURK|nr:MFS transporter [Paraburkholderia susongensis]SMG55467.1 MFS transporter, ACS family, hexuronate transporter [Paraburkholderia susongensis]
MTIKVKGLRWWMIGLLTLGTITNYLARSSLSVAAPTVMHHLNISTQQYGWITGAFLIMYPIGAPLTGYLMDRIGLRMGFLLCGVLWSLICMAHGFAEGWVGLLLLRGALGLVEAAFIPGGMRAATYWFPAQERGTAAGVFNLGTSTGAILAPPLIAWSILHYDWHIAFMIVGAFGLAWAVLWLLLYRHPDRHPALSKEEAAYIDATQEQAGSPSRAAHAGEGQPPKLFEILKQRNFWGIALPRFCADPVWGTLGYWMPLYLYQARGFDLKAIALTAWLPFVAADLGCMVGGPLSAWLKRRFDVPLVNGKRIAFTMAACLMTGMAGVGFVHSPAMAVFLLCLGGFAHQTLSITVISMSADLFPRREVGTVTGLAALVAGLGNFAFTMTMGWFVGRVGYAPFFVALGFGDLIGATILWTLVRRNETPQPEASARQARA